MVKNIITQNLIGQSEKYKLGNIQRKLGSAKAHQRFKAKFVKIIYSPALIVKPEKGPEASIKPGQKSCVRSRGIITLSARWPMVWDEARLRRGHNDQSPL
jgi:hypothetical protein